MINTRIPVKTHETIFRTNFGSSSGIFNGHGCVFSVLCLALIGFPRLWIGSFYDLSTVTVFEFSERSSRLGMRLETLEARIATLAENVLNSFRVIRLCSGNFCGIKIHDRRKIRNGKWYFELEYRLSQNDSWVNGKKSTVICVLFLVRLRTKTGFKK